VELVVSGDAIGIQESAPGGSAETQPAPSNQQPNPSQSATQNPSGISNPH